MVGTSHLRAELDLREPLHVVPADAGAFAARLAAEEIEAVVLSTCNRTEIYLAAHDAGLAAALARGALVDHSGLSLADLEPILDELRDGEAARHLFRVAAGLDSLLPGEAQILGQVREAFELARAAGATGPVLNRVFSHALHAGKRVRTETGVGTIPAAIPAAAAALAQRVVGDLAGRRVLVIGAGKMGALAATSFLDRGAERVFVANHRIERAEELARRFGGETVPFERIGEELARADVVLSSTRCPQAILHTTDVAPALARRDGRPLLLVDIAVPRDIDPAVGDLEGCVLYDLDALGPEGGQAVERRDAETAEAERIVSAEAAGIGSWLRSQDAVPVVAALHRRADEIRTAELARASSRLEGLSEEERQSVEMLTAQIVSKLLHEPTVRAKEGPPAQAEALRALFALDEDPA